MEYIVSSGENTSGILLNGASMTVLNGGTADDTTIKNYGTIFVSKGGVVNSTFVDNQSKGYTSIVHLSVKGTANNTILSGGTLHIMNGGVANDTLVTCFAHPTWGDYVIDGKIVVSIGGTANRTVVKGIWNDYFQSLSGGFAELQGGVANDTYVTSGGRLFVYNGGVANDTVVDGYPTLYGSNNMDDVYSGTVEVRGGTVNRIMVNYGGRLNMSGGTAFGIVENGGYVNAVPGSNVTFASNTFSGLLFSSPVSKGAEGVSATVHSGTTAVDITVMDGGFLTIYSGGKLTGKISDLGGSVSALDGAIVDFDLTRTAPGATALLYDLGGIAGTPSFTVTVGADQAEGVYTLADGASEFSGTITVVNTSGETLNTMTVGETAIISGVEYTLILSDSTLSMKVGDAVVPSPYTSDGLILSGETVTLGNEEVYHDTLICSGGTLSIEESGRTADGVTVLPGGSLILEKGSAVNVVESGGYVEFADDADVSFTPNTFSNAYIMQNEKATLHSGTTACNLKLAGELFIYDGGVADVVEPLHAYRPPHNSFGITVFSGGTANSVNLINGWCVMTVSSGGVVNDTKITSFSFADDHGGRLIIESGGTANNILIERGDGSIIVSRGGTATNIVENGGYVSAADGANVSFVSNTFTGISISSASATVHSGTTAVDVSLSEKAALIVFSGGTANNTRVKQFGGLFISSGGVANNTVVSSGSMYISSGGTANNTTVSQYVSMYVSSGGTANSITVSNGGKLYVRSGGMITGRMSFSSRASVTLQEGAILDFDLTQAFAGDSALLNDLSLVLAQSSPRLTLTVDGTEGTGAYALADYAANFGGTITVRNTSGLQLGKISVGESITVGGVIYTLALANGVLLVSTVSDGPVISSGLVVTTSRNIYANETYEETSVNAGGSLFILSGGMANDTAVNSKGSMFISSGGTAIGTTVNSRGNMYVSRGGTANSTTINSNGSMYVSSGGIADNTAIKYQGSMVVSSGGTAIGTTVDSRGNMYVSNGGTANNTTVNSGGSLSLLSGGIANDITVNTFGKIVISRGGTATNITVNSKGIMYVSSGGTALNIDWTPCEAIVTVKAGAVVTFVSQYSGVYYGADNQLLSNAAVMDDMTLSESEEMYVMSAGTVNRTTINGGWIEVSSGGIANDTTVNEDGEMYVRSGGTAYNTIVNEYGWLSLENGTVCGISVGSNGSFNVSGGGKLTGKMTFEAGAEINLYQEEESVLDFDLTKTSAGAEALLNDLSIIQGTPLYTLTVDGTQADGVYSLAEGAAGFDSTISVVNTAGDELGTLMIGETVTLDDADYTLNLSDGTLSVVVVSSVVPVPDWTFFNGDFNGDGKDMLAAKEQDGCVVTIFNDGASWGAGLVLDPGWEIAGVGDFNGDGADDFLRVNEEGYVVGEMSNGNGAFSPQVLNFLNEGWSILGVGDFNGNGTDDVLIANPTAASDTVGLLGYWESGATWTLINGYSPEWEYIATGDYNGDGKCDMLWRNSFEGEGGLTYNAYCTWIVEDPVDWRMVSVANPAEWNFLCSGDFDGDKMNDIAMINDIGVVGIWGVNDGYLSSWSILSAVTSEWQLAGVGDFNGDGTDDIAWCSATTGQVGCWQIENKELASWQTLAHVV